MDVRPAWTYATACNVCFQLSFSSMPHHVIRQFYIREARRESGLRSIYSQSEEAMLINHLLFQPPNDPSGTWRIALHALKKSEREEREREREIQIKLAYDTRNWTISDMIRIFFSLRYQRAMSYNTDDLSHRGRWCYLQPLTHSEEAKQTWKSELCCVCACEAERYLALIQQLSISEDLRLSALNSKLLSAAQHRKHWNISHQALLWTPPPLALQQRGPWGIWKLGENVDCVLSK